ncbi:MAG: cysteine desulfurase family protein, partial [Syntrophales bacterium]
MDHSATTPTDPEVLGVMMPYYGNHYGNPSSIHTLGREAREAVDHARQQVAGLIGADSSEIVFTAGGTEADNLAVLGAALAFPAPKRHVITSAIEHHAVLNPCRHLESIGFQVTYLPVDVWGRVNIKDVKQSLTKQTCLISIMHANNELGTLEPLAEIGMMARKCNVAFHTDAVQTVGRIPVNVDELRVDLLSLSSHKIYGPKGAGALYVRKGITLRPLMYGGQQESGRRTGTENVPGIAGLGKACEIAGRDLMDRIAYIRYLRDRLENGITINMDDIRINTHPEEHLPHVLNVSFTGIAGEKLVRELDMKGISVSSGAACTADSV